MSVERQFYFQGQMRVDVPHLRTLDSSNANDFDILAGQSLAGGQALVVRGFNIIATGAIGTPASGLQLQVDPGLVWHFNASEAGTIFRTQVGTAPEVLVSTNPRVQGSFTASQLNYVGLDLLRSSDPSTSDLVEFLDATTLEENPETVPLARTLNYSIIISTSDFVSQPNVLPLALVTTDANNHVVSIQDARAMAFRLGTGGTIPNPYATYAWPQGRNETANADGFSGGDKAFASLRDAVQGIEGRLQEVGGGPFWYSPTADRHVKLIRNLGVRFSTGDNFFVDGSGHLLWRGLAFVFCNAQDTSGNAVYQNTINDQATELTGLTDIQIGECIYVDINEQPAGSLYPTALAVQAVKVSMSSLGIPTPPYTRWVIAWRTSFGYFTLDSQFGVGTLIAPAGVGANGVVELNTAPATALITTPHVVTADASGAAVATGLTLGLTALAPTFGPGVSTLQIGYGEADLTVLIGDFANIVTNQAVGLGCGPAAGGNATSVDGNLINIGHVNSSAPHIVIGNGTSDILTLETATLNIGTAGIKPVVTVQVTSFALTATTGNVDIDSTSGSIFIGGTTGGSVNLGNTTTTNIQGSTIQVVSTGGATLEGANTFVQATAGTLSLGTSSGTTAINLGTGSSGATAITIGNTAGPVATLSLLCGDAGAGGTINIGNEAADDNINIGNASARSAIVIQSGNGEILVTCDGGPIKIADESASTTTTIGKQNQNQVLSLFGGRILGLQNVVSTSTLALATSSELFQNLTGGSVPTIVLPTPVQGQTFVLMNNQSASVNVDPGGSVNLFIGSSTYTHGSQYVLGARSAGNSPLRIISDGTNWYAW